MKKIKLKKNDLIQIEDEKFLVVSMNKLHVELLPMNVFFDDNLVGGDSNLKFKIRKVCLHEYEILDSFELLYLLNETNPILKKAIQDLMYE